MIEESIIASVFSEDRFNEVGFLVPTDFKRKGNAKLWEGITHYKGDIIEFVKSLELNERQDWVRAVEYNCSGPSIYSLSQLGLALVELSFRRTLDRLLQKLADTSTDAIQIYLLNEAKKEIPRVDIFDLSESLNEYFGDKVDGNVKERIQAYNNWKDKRIEEIKRYL